MMRHCLTAQKQARQGERLKIRGWTQGRVRARPPGGGAGRGCTDPHGEQHRRFPMAVTDVIAPDGRKPLLPGLLPCISGFSS